MTRAFVCGCAGLVLSAEERAFLARSEPWGLILFKRNVEAPDQLRRLVADFRESVGRRDAPVLIDQEGGRVQRLAPPNWHAYPAASAYGAVALADRPIAVEAARLGGRLIAYDLADAGLTIDCAPVLDLPAPGSSNVVGNRAFGHAPDLIEALGRAFAEGLLDGGILPVIKHMPGHGRAEVDSHFELPVVKADRSTLEGDFEPFRGLADLPIAMTAHVIYTAIDPDRPATISRLVIDTIIRGAIGFEGLLLSDDLSMQALDGDLGQRAEAALSAGCDMALHCNGNLDEADAVASAAPALSGKAARRAETALARRQTPKALDLAAARARLAQIMAVPTVATA